LKQLAPNAVIPPSPKRKACIASATDIAMIDAHGPSAIAAIPTPTGCPVVPPGSGRLNIMITKQKADDTEISGARRALKSRLQCRAA
jgi:hypothetical protein